ncbi:MAG: sugar 3,4-ketoisomerase [Candidatus Rifleibacteriota bacterium]
MKPAIFNFEIMGDDRGSLVALESLKNIPFEIKRIYYIFDTKVGVKRGCHAHKKLKQIVVCLNGSCKCCLDDGFEKAEVTLDSPDRGLFIDEMTWRELYDFSPDCVLMVLADNYFSEEDYIRDYCKFKALL